MKCACASHELRTPEVQVQSMRALEKPKYCSHNKDRCLCPSPSARHIESGSRGVGGRVLQALVSMSDKVS